MCLCFASIILKFLECKLFCFVVFFGFLKTKKSYFSNSSIVRTMRERKNCKNSLRKHSLSIILERNRLKHLLLLLLPFNNFKMVLFQAFISSHLFHSSSLYFCLKKKFFWYSIDAVTLYWGMFSLSLSISIHRHKWNRLNIKEWCVYSYSDWVLPFLCVLKHTKLYNSKSNRAVVHWLNEIVFFSCRCWKHSINWCTHI